MSRTKIPSADSTVPDVRRAFADIRPHADKLVCWAGSVLPAVYSDNNLDVHFQGVQRLRRGRFLAITGSSPTASHLVIVAMASRNASGAFRSNCLRSADPPEGDRVVALEAISEEFKHAGGFQMLGDHLAIGVEEDGASEVAFYDLTDPLKPQKLYSIRRTNEDLDVKEDPATAGAVALAKLPGDGRYLLIVGRTNSNTLDFYRSARRNLKNPGFEYMGSWRERYLMADSDDVDHEFGNYQTINLIPQSDGRMFLVGLHNSALLDFGQDWADLFELEFTSGQRPVIIKVDKKHLYTTDRISMDAGAGVSFGRGNGLHLYAVRHWAERGKITFNEFRPLPAEVDAPITDIKDAWAEFYEDTKFEKTCLFVEYPNRDEPEYVNFRALKGLGGRPSSVRWLIPEGWVLDIFDRRDHKGTRASLLGTGNIKADPDLHVRGWNDRIVSCRYRPVTVTAPADGWIELYDDAEFRDRRLTIRGTRDGKKADYGKERVEGKPFKKKVSSVRWQIPEGRTYRLYAEVNFEGPTLDLQGDGRLNEITDLRDEDFGDKVASSQYVPPGA